MKKIILLSILSLFVCSLSFGQATGIVYNNYTTSGSLGSADTSIDVNSFINIPQTTAGITITMPTPTNQLAGKNITISNIGTVPFTLIPGGIIYPNTGVILRWTKAWDITGTGIPSVSTSANKVFCSPAAGAGGVPDYRTLVSNDIPSLAMSKITWTGSISQYVRGDGTLATLPASGTNFTVTSISAAGRSFNTAYQVSTTNLSEVNLSFSISCSLSLTSGTSGEVYLEYSANGTTGWTLAGMIPASNTGTLVIGLNTVQISGGQLSVKLPAGYYWRLRTNSVTGTPTYTFNGGTSVVFN